MNRHGICASYNTVRRIDVDIAERIITTAGDNRVPLPAVLEATSPLNGAMDNFDRNESTLAGTGSTHDTILVLFQNVPVNEEKPSEGSEISTRLPVSQDSDFSQATIKGEGSGTYPDGGRISTRHIHRGNIEWWT